MEERLNFPITVSGDAERKIRGIGAAGQRAGDQLAGLKLSGLKLAVGAGLAGLGPGIGLLSSLPAVAGAGAAAVGTLAFATRGMGDAMSAAADGDAAALEEALDRLSPSARRTVREAMAVRGAWSSLQGQVQEDLFAPTLGSMAKVSTAYLPAMQRSLPDVARGLGEAGAELAGWAAAAPTVAKVEAIIASSVPQTRNYAAGVEDVLDAVLSLGVHGIPVAEKLSEKWASGAAGFRRWVDAGAESGRLDAVLSSTADTVDLLGEATATTGRILDTVFANPATIDSVNTLFSLIGSGLRSVESLANGFASLPPGLQQFIILSAGAAVVGSKFHGVLNNIATGSTAAAGGLNKQSRATAALGSASSVAGAALVAGGLMNFINTSTSAAIYGQAGSIDEMSQAMTKLGKTGDSSGLAKMNGSFTGLEKSLTGSSDDLDYFARKLVTSDHWISKFGRDLDDVTQWFIPFSTGNREAANKVAGLDQALASMVGSGNSAEAAAGFKQIADAAMAKGETLEFVKAKFPAYAAALKTNAAAQGPVAEAAARTAAAQKLLGMSFAEATREAGGLSNALGMLNGTAQGAAAAQIQFEGALDGVAESARTNGKSLDVGTEAGRANKAAVLDAISATSAYAAALEKNGESADSVNAKLSTMRARLRAQMLAAGYSQAAVDGLLASLFQIPGNTAARISTPGAKPSTNDVNSLNRQIRALRDKRARIIAEGAPNAAAQVAAVNRQIRALQSREITITTIRRNVTFTNEWGDRENAGARRWGGIREAAGGLLNAQVVGAGTLYQWAEPETGGEAFIPRRGDMDRSRGIARKVVEEWLGGPEKVWPQRGSAGAGGSAPVVRGSDGSSAPGASQEQLVALLVRALSQVSVVLDGRAVGALQGRSSDLVYRGG